MSINTCIRHPEKNPYIQLFAWQVAFCQNNHCAALLLAYFTGWHDWKLRNDQYYARYNDIAERHTGERPYIENAYLFFTTQDFIDGCMGLYSNKKTIADALDLLVELGVISIHNNPNPRYYFDKTKYFRFYPAACNRWIAEHYPIADDADENEPQVSDYSDKPKMADRRSENTPRSNENGLRSAKSSRPANENGRTITNTTINTTKQNKSIITNDELIDESIKSEMVEAIIEVLIEKGIPRTKVTTDAVKGIYELHIAGATLNQFINGYDISTKYTKGKGFGINYLLKVVESLVVKAKQAAHSKSERQGISAANESNHEPKYESDLRNAAKWASDLL